MPRRNNRQSKAAKRIYSPTSCTNKRRYANKLAAERQAYINMLSQPDLELSVYSCDSCKGWHLTSRLRQS